jgi:hypothetical protein
VAYGHAERNLACIRQLETETRELFGHQVQPVEASHEGPRVQTAPSDVNRDTCRVAHLEDNLAAAQISLADDEYALEAAVR